MIAYILRLMEGSGSAGRPFREQDLLLFERSDGGRAIRIRTATPGFVTLVHANFSKMLHGNVLPRNGRRAGEAAGSVLLRLVGYTVKEVPAFVARFKRLAPRDKKVHWERIVNQCLSVPMRLRKGLPARGNTYVLRWKGIGKS